MSVREPQGREGGPLAWATGIAALMVLGGLQISQLAWWGPIRVDGLLAMAISWAALTGSRGGLVFGMISGAVEDTLIGGGITFTVLRGFEGWLAGRTRPILNVRQSLVGVPLVALATVFQEACLALLHHDWGHFEAIWLWAMLANSLVAWPLYRLAAAIWRPGRGPAAKRRAV